MKKAMLTHSRSLTSAVAYKILDGANIRRILKTHKLFYEIFSVLIVFNKNNENQVVISTY